MNRALIAGTLVVSLAFPGAAAAKESPKDKRNAAKECRAERGTDDAARQAFAEKYGTNASKSNAFGKCVSLKVREERAERRAAKREAKQTCKAERTELGREAFAQKYGTNRNKRNAFGKCVSKAARKAKSEEDKEDRQEAAELRNAAQECKAEREQLGSEAFAEKHGKNANKKNAFGKCVSAKAKSEGDEPEDGSPSQD